MGKNLKNIILWDIDGTLLLTGGAGVVSFNRVFQELFNEPYIWKNIHPDGRTDDDIIVELYYNRFGVNPSSKQLSQIKTLYNQKMGEEIPRSPAFRLMPEATSTLERLNQDSNNLMGLATGNYKEAAEHKLKRANMNHYFKFGGFGCDSPVRQELTRVALERGMAQLDKIRAKPDRVILVGDTVHDVACGLGVGAEVVGVATGSTSVEALKKAGATWALPDLSTFFSVGIL